MKRIFCDGGVIGPNPSKLGGTWCWCLIGENDTLLISRSGIVQPQDLGTETVTNNHTELFAALMAMESMQSFPGIALYTDSLITLRRITAGMRFNGCPDWMRDRVLNIRRIVSPKVTLVKGHPTKKELSDGLSRRGLPTSKWNVYCDRTCTALAKDYKLHLT